MLEQQEEHQPPIRTNTYFGVSVNTICDDPLLCAIQRAASDGGDE
jgi:hypothetical protein